MERELLKTNLEKKSAPEYSFDAGVIQILDRVNDILKKQPFAVIAFSASGDNVGKTQLAKTLIEDLYQRGIFCKSFHHPSEVQIEKGHKQMVIIFDQMEWDSAKHSSHKRIKELHTADTVKSLKKMGYEITGIDLWVGIYRPDKPFYLASDPEEELVPIADIIIRNERARDKMAKK